MTQVNSKADREKAKVRWQNRQAIMCCDDSSSQPCNHHHSQAETMCNPFFSRRNKKVFQADDNLPPLPFATAHLATDPHAHLKSRLCLFDVLLGLTHHLLLLLLELVLCRAASAISLWLQQSQHANKWMHEYMWTFMTLLTGTYKLLLESAWTDESNQCSTLYEQSVHAE